MRLIVSLGLVAALALSAAACSKGAAASGDQIRAYLLEHPEVIEEAVAKLQQKRQAAADTQLKQALLLNKVKLERDPRDYVVGNPDGKVTVVEFFDYRCPYCKAAMGDIDKLVAANKDIRFVLKEFPVLGPVSDSAARAAVAAKAQGKYWPVHRALLAEKNLDDAAIARILSENGVDVDRAAKDAVATATTQALNETHELARLTGINGTPAFVIGDRMVAGWVPADLQAGITAARNAG